MKRLAAYFDASGTHATSQVVVVAGYVATYERWRTFQSKWKNILAKEGLEFFHMTDFENRKGPYKDWSQKQRLHVIKKLIDAIKQRTLFGVAVMTANDEYQANKYKFPFLDSYSAFTFSISQVLHSIANWAERNRYSGEIDYFLEQGDGYKRELDGFKRSIEEEQWRKDRLRYGMLGTLDKRDNYPLQAADILAYENYKEALNYSLPKHAVRPRRKSGIRLLHGVEYYGRFYDAKSLDPESVRFAEPP